MMNTGMLTIKLDKHLIQEEIVSAVYEKIEECGICIPYYEVEKYYCSKKNKYRKRYENANLSATD